MRRPFLALVCFGLCLAIACQQKRMILRRARDYVVSICGTDVVPLMEDICWIS